MSTNDDDKIIRLEFVDHKRVDTKMMEQKMRCFYSDILEAFFEDQTTVETPHKSSDIAEHYATTVNLDLLIKYTTELKGLIAKYLIEMTGVKTPNPEEEASFNKLDSKRFMAWSIIVNSTEPRFTSDQIVSALETMSDDDFDRYLTTMRDAST